MDLGAVLYAMLRRTGGKRRFNINVLGLGDSTRSGMEKLRELKAVSGTARGTIGRAEAPGGGYGKAPERSWSGIAKEAARENGSLAATQPER